MLPSSRSAFCFSADAGGTTRYAVNVCGNDSVGVPLTRAMDPVSEAFLDEHGLDNLIVPISVATPQRLPEGDPYDFSVDVVVHSWLTTKAIGPHRLRENFVFKLTALAVEWVLQECGIHLIERTCKYMGGPMYYGKPPAVPFAEVLQRAVETVKKEQEKSEQNSPATDAPQCFNMAAPTPKPPAKGPLIREVISEPLIKKGFLVDTKAQLYGPEGSGEGTGKPYDGLAHIPASLRERCQVIDTRVPSQATTPPCTANTSEAPSRPGWTLLSVDTNDNQVTVRLLAPPHVQRVSEVDLAVSEDTVEVEGRTIKLPVLVDADSTRAKFLKSSGTLVITCQCER